jgi:hypothetical protein
MEIKPQILSFELPAGEQKAEEEINSLLVAQHTYTGRLASALSLFDFAAGRYEAATAHCESERAKLDRSATDYVRQRTPLQIEYMKQSTLFVDWEQIAARDGAVTIFHFGITARQIAKALDACPTVKQMCPAITEESILGEELRDFWSVRNAAVHEAENSIKNERHTVAGPLQLGGLGVVDGASAFLTSFIEGRTCSFTVKGELHTFEMSQKTLASLVAAKRRAYAAFQVVENTQRARLVARHMPRPPGE